MGALRLSIRAKLLATAVLLILLAAVIATLAIAGLGDVRRQGGDLYNKTYGPRHHQHGPARA